MKFVVVIAALALLPTSAGAVVLQNPDGSIARPYQNWANRSKVPTPNVRLTLYHDVSMCAVTSYETLITPSGCTLPGQWIALAPDTCTPGPGDPVAWVRLVCKGALLHELGHNVALTDAEQAELEQTFRVPDWWSGGNYSAAERFAETYSMCAMGKRRIAFETPDLTLYYESDPPLGPTSFWRICRMLHQSNASTQTRSRRSFTVIEPDEDLNLIPMS